MKKLLTFLKTDVARIIFSLIFFISALIVEQMAYPYMALALYVVALMVSGFRVFWDAIRGILRRDLLDEKFLMSIASIGAMIVGEWSEGVAVMLFFLVGETFEHYAVRKSRASIRSLMHYSIFILVSQTFYTQKTQIIKKLKKPTIFIRRSYILYKFCIFCLIRHQKVVLKNIFQPCLVTPLQQSFPYQEL